MAWFGFRKKQSAAPELSPPAEPVPDTIDSLLDASGHRAAWDHAAATHPDPAIAARAFLQTLVPAGLPATSPFAEVLKRTYPEASWPYMALTAAAAASKDRAVTLVHAREAYARFPDLPEAARALLDALAATSRFEEADALAAELAPRLDGQEWFVRTALNLSRRHTDHERTLAYANRIIELAPATPQGYAAASQALRALGRAGEADDVAARGLQACPNAPALLTEAAHTAQSAGNLDLAYSRWAALRTLQPTSPDGYLGAIKLSINQQQPDVTRTLLEEALDAFPEDRKLRVTAARNAIRGLLWAEATAHWDALLASAPDDPALALEAVTSFIGPRLGRRQRMPKVFKQLAAHHERFPNYGSAYAAHIDALREVGRLEEAETHGQEWRARFPHHQDLAIACARVAEEQGRSLDATAILKPLRARSQPTLAMDTAYLRALSLSFQDEEAEQVCEQALVRYPQNMRIIDQYVALATRRGDFEDAASRAERLVAEFPQNAAIARLSRRLNALRDGADSPAAEPAPADAGPAAFFARFESLGATTAGCEFGLVQRRFGAEPLGLLRWGNMPVEGLTRALQQRFEGFGQAENTRIVVQRASANHKEYFLYDDSYSYWGHTFIKADDAPADVVLKQSLRRLTFLRGKLLEDMDQGDKVFVFKMTKDAGEEALLALYAALSAYGTCTLLCVTLEDAAHKRGTLEMVRPGLFLGRAAMFMDAGSGEERGIDTDLWRSFCEDVMAWHDSTYAKAAELTDAD